jgi:hypothetical protein
MLLNKDKQKQFNIVCAHIADGMSLVKACQQPDTPNRKTILNWLIADRGGELNLIYTRAREEMADHLADAVLDIARNTALSPEDRRIEIDACKWIAAKQRPRKYGDKIGDGGVDGVIDQDALGLDRVYIQAKRYAEGNNVGPGAIRDFFGSLDRFKASKGLFVTTSAFSSDARDTANQLSKRIVLIDGDSLTRLMVRFNVGCRIEETLHMRKLDEDFFAD